MREKESKIRFTKEDPAREAASSEGTHTRPKPRPPSGNKLRLTGQEAREASVSEAMHSETAHRAETNIENTAGVREGFSPQSENQGASPETEIYDTGHAKQGGTDIRSAENNTPRKTGAGKLRYRSAGAEKFEQSAGYTSDVPDRTAETMEGRSAEKTAVKTASVRDAAKTKAQKSFGSKLRTENSASKAQSGKLRFESKDADPVTLEKPVRHVRPVRAAGTVLSGQVHAKTAEYENDNVGVEALNETEGMAETGVRQVTSGRYGRKLHQAGMAGKLEEGSNLHFEDGPDLRTGSGTSPGAGPAAEAYSKGKACSASGEAAKAGETSSTNPVSRWRQKQAIKKEYAAARAGKTTGAAGGSAAAGSNAAGGSKAAETAGKAAKKSKEAGEKVIAVVKEHPMAILLGGVLAIVILVVASSLSSCSAMLSGSGNAVLATSFTATDEDIRGAEADYCAMEEELRERIRQIQEDNPDYDEYEIDTGEINHNPYELAAFLTVLYEDYTREEVQRTLREIFEAQYEYSTSHRTETVTETKQVRVGESLGQVVTSGYCNCPICCGIWSGGPTASGVYPTANHTIAVDAYNPFVPMGTKVIMNGTEYTVEDTGNFDRYGVQFDVYYDDHWTATLHGHKTWEAYIADDNGSNVVEVTKTETKKILTVKVTNHTLNSVVEAWGLTDEQMERYRILVAQRGNRDYLFADNIYANPSEVLHYDIPGEALSDVRFARMITEAEKYLGYPYVWGGASPSTSFDCSGFVSWVINHCGNGWNYGRLTADGLKGICAIIPRSEAKPGDLIFFQGTYNTSGASHVGIYVGNGMMIHCGNPIQYASIDTSYWQQHFYCFGRLP